MSTELTGLEHGARGGWEAREESVTTVQVRASAA